MDKFKVGDKVRVKQGLYAVDSVLFSPARVTEITDRGFKYEYLSPVSLGPRHGMAYGGETYVPETYEVIEEGIAENI